jgi:hypothetical protein
MKLARNFHRMNFKNTILFSIFCLCLAACEGCKDDPKPIDPTVKEETFGTQQDVGTVENKEIDEASGITPSIGNLNFYWTHNDSGDLNRIFLIDKTGKGSQEFTLKGAVNRDWEDIAITEFSDGAYLYVADIGDNFAIQEIKNIYRCKEPVVTNNTPQKATIDKIEQISFKYPDGMRDAETILIDHETKDLYIVTKREAKKRLYRLPYPQSTTQIITAEFVTELEFAIPFTKSVEESYFLTAGSISLDSQEILIRSYTQIFYWKRAKNEKISDALKRSANLLSYTYDAVKEPQGEGICWTKDKSGLFTIGEKMNPHFYFYPRTTK